MFFKEFDVRRHARSEGRRYCDPVVLTYQAERMPEQIRLKVSSLIFRPSDWAKPCYRIESMFRVGVLQSLSTIKQSLIDKHILVGCSKAQHDFGKCKV